MTDRVETLLVGIDRATADAAIGLALAEYDSVEVRLKGATLRGRERVVASVQVSHRRWLLAKGGFLCYKPSFFLLRPREFITAKTLRDIGKAS
jgi:hypothetical protein